MSVLQKKTSLTEQAYLAFEEECEAKYEYVDGEIYAMAGASRRHNQISLNMAVRLRLAARGGCCGVFISDMKLRADDGRFYYYPDVILSCDADDNAPFHSEKPCLIAEVLSKSTARTDRGEKWLTYQKIPSLRYYLLVDSQKKQVDYFIRTETGKWICAELEDGETLTVECENYQTVLTLADIYDDVAF